VVWEEGSREASPYPDFYIFSSGGSVDERLIGDLQAERGE